jgi:nucleotide-binding universal stress UspA family protein
MKHILVTTDFSKESSSAFDYVKGLLALHEEGSVRCTVLTILEDMSTGSAQFQLALAVLDSHGIRDELQKQSEENLDRLIEKNFKDVKVDKALVRAKQAVHLEILEYARANDVDLIAIATHGRSGVAHLVLGSVSERLIRNSNIPVLVIPVDKSAKEEDS